MSLCVLLFFSSSLPAAKSPEPYRVTGIEGALLKNVQKRLAELSLHQEFVSMDEKLQRRQISQALQPYGYFRGSCIISRKSDNILEIRVNPGPQMLVESLYIEILGEGKDNPVIQESLKNLPIQPGQPLLTNSYSQAKTRILTAAESEGFLKGHFSQSEILIDTDAYSAKIKLIFDTGQQFRFGKAIFSQTNISPALLKKYLPFQYGEIFSAKKILALNQELSNSLYFKHVSVIPEPGENRYIPVNIITEPQKRLNYTMSAGYGTDTGLRGRAGFSIIPINDQGQILKMLLQGSFKENLLQMQYLIPGSHPAREKFLLSGTASTQKYDNGYGKSVLLSMAHDQQHSWFHHNLSLNALIEKFHYEDKPDNTQKLLFPKLELVHKQQSDSLFSPSGYYVNLNMSGSHDKWLSRLGFAKISLDAKAAWMFDALKTRLLLHTSLGLIQTRDIYKMPLSMASLLGGSQNMKGYSFNSIGPGKKLIYLGMEVQKLVKPNWYITGFFDAGDVYNPGPRNLHYDIGAGLMWITPVGPVKIAVAKPFGKYAPQGKNLRLVLGMGADW